MAAECRWNSGLVRARDVDDPRGRVHRTRAHRILGQEIQGDQGRTRRSQGASSLAPRHALHVALQEDTTHDLVSKNDEILDVVRSIQRAVGGDVATRQELDAVSKEKDQLAVRLLQVEAERDALSTQVCVEQVAFDS